jgi:ADP-dependent phosphofructokinase/glucokinase
MAMLACGFTANVDGIAQLDEKLVEQLCSRYTAQQTQRKRPSIFLRYWGEVLDAIAWNLHHGSGGEYIVTSSWLLDSIRDMTQWQWSVGGTGLQAACAAAIAGHGALVNMPAWAEDYSFLLNHSGLETAYATSQSPPVHYILEYKRGQSTNRIIFRGTGEFAESLIAPTFAQRVQSSPSRYSALLVSGYNAADSAAGADLFISEQIRFLSSLQPGAPKAHLELAASYSAEEQLRTILRFRTYVHSIGCNEDEAAELLQLDGALLELPNEQLLDALERLRRLCDIPYLIVHTNQFALCIGVADTRQWAGALRNGIVFAASRAVSGHFCTKDEMNAIVSRLLPNQRGVQLAKAAALRPELCIVPAFDIPVMRGTTGLGDTFTSGLLCLLS